MKDKPRRMPGTQVLIGMAVFIVIAVIIALALSGRNVRTYEPGTPEATAQAFVQALFDEDADTAYTFLSEDLKEKCLPRDFDLWWVRSSDSASFDEVRITGDHAEIEMRLMSRNYDLGIFPFENYDYSQQTELELDRFDGEWLITNATWPLAGCTWR